MYHTLNDRKEKRNMDPFTFGLVFVGASGGSLLLLSALESSGLKLNKTAINLALEITKYGGILALLSHISKLFL
jgi:hypothetical protein